MNLPFLDSPFIEFLVQSGSASSAQKAGAIFGSLLALAVVLFLLLITHLVTSFCFKKICEKAGHTPGVLVWIPIANFVPLLETAKLPVWMIVLLLIPFVQIAGFVFLFWKLCEARGKAGPLALLMLVPFGNLGLILYLAFAD